MSLLATASPYYSESSENNDISSRRQQSHNRTLKQRKETNNNKEQEEDELIPMRPNVAAMMKALNNMPPEDGTGLADFNPPPKTEMTRETSSSSSNQSNIQNKNNLRQGFTTLAQAAPYEYDLNSNINNNDNKVKQGGPRANDDNAVENSKYNSLPSNYANAYYQQLVGLQNTTQNLHGLDIENYQILNERLNHIIHLLEEQQNSRTNTVTEELILYCFLGVFIIFIVDSFARVGKYSR